MVIAARYISSLISSTSTQVTILQSFTLSDTSGAGSSGFFPGRARFRKGRCAGRQPAECSAQ